MAIIEGSTDLPPDGKIWRYNGKHGDTVYYKCSSQHCPATKRVKGNRVTFSRTHSSDCSTLVPLTTIEEVIKQHQNGMTGHEIKRSVKTSISVSSSCPPPPNVVLPHSPPILPSFPNPIYFERGINSAIAQHIRETRPFDLTMKY